MGAAYKTLEPAAVPRATTTLNILQRVGGSIATALVAVVLQRGITHRASGSASGGLGAVEGTKLPQPVANAIGHAFGATFWWVIGLTAVGAVASFFLPRGVPAPANATGEQKAASAEETAAGAASTEKTPAGGPDATGLTPTAAGEASGDDAAPVSAEDVGAGVGAGETSMD